VLNELGVSYAVVGGVACVLYGVRRLTTDIDVILEKLSEETIELLVKYLKREGYKLPLYEALSALRDEGHFTVITEDGFRIDFKYARTSLDYESLERTVQLEIHGVRVILTRLEENIAAKIMVLESLKDLEDAVELMLIHYDTIDRKRLARLLGKDPINAIKELMIGIETEFKDIMSQEFILYLPMVKSKPSQDSQLLQRQLHLGLQHIET